MNSLFIRKVNNRIAHEKNKLWRYLPVESFPLLSIKGLEKKNSFFKVLSVALGPLDQHVFVSSSEVDRKRIIANADAALEHRFVILGKEVRLEPMDWHSDCLAGYTWHKGAFYKDYNVDINTHKVDGKVPWEISRCHHLLWLGEAYRYTHDEKYARGLLSDITNWIDENPLMHSVNWTCSMDVAIRAVNWMYALWLINESGAITDFFIKKLVRSLYQHGFFIRNNLERNIPYSNNHYAADLAGLLYISSLFQTYAFGRRWKRFASQEYYNEVITQILPSGAHYERSISYHRLMIEIFVSCYYLLKREGIRIPLAVEEKLSLMYRFAYNYIKPNGFAPLIEDNDDGRFLPFVKRDFREQAYLLEENSIENVLIRGGEQSIPYEKKENIYADAGHWIKRFSDAYLFFTNGGQSRFPTTATEVSTHTHNDLCSYELALGEDDIIIDPGTYRYVFSTESYTEGRNEYRSTKKHNTIMVDDEEQHTLSNTKLFVIRKNAIIDSDDTYHTNSGLKHRRTFDCKDSELVVNDYIQKPGNNHQVLSWLHFSPEIKLAQNGNSIEFESEHYKGLIVVPTDGAVLKIKGDTISPSYGVIQESKTIEMSMAFNDWTEIQTVIKWKKK